MKRAFIVHGYGGYPDKNWFPWLKAQLVIHDIMVEVPAMPNSNSPVFAEWLTYLQKLVGRVDSDTYFVGHSLGCAIILRLLENIDENECAGGAVLVAGFAEPIHFTELDGFTASVWHDEKIKKSAKLIVLINSDDDPHVPLEMAEHMQSRFRASLRIMPGAQHINGKAGFTKVPLIYQELSKMIGI